MAVQGPRQEALQLYREILQTAHAFSWMDDHGDPWRDGITKSARREFEDWRGERDPALIAERIMISRHCLMDIQNRFVERAQQLQVEEQATMQRVLRESGADAAAAALSKAGGGSGGRPRMPLHERIEARMRRGPLTEVKSMK